MTAATSESLKSDRNVQQREVKIKTKNHVTGPYTTIDTLVLFVCGFALSPHTDAMDRLWLWFEFNKWELGLSVSILQCENEGTGKPYWSFKALIGPLCVRLTRRKKSKVK